MKEENECVHKRFFERCYERSLIKREYNASMSQQQEPAIRFMKSVEASGRNRERPCFYLFFDQRPRNYVIVVIPSIISFSVYLLYNYSIFYIFLYFRDENIQRKRGRDDNNLNLETFAYYYLYLI